MSSSAADSNAWDAGEPSANIAAQTEKRRELNLLHVAWSSRWLIVLCVIVGGVGGWVALQRAIPRYTSMSRIYVERNMPALLGREYQVGQSATYLFTQAELIRSTSVLAIAAEDADNADLESFRGVDNRVGFLKGCLQVAVGSQDDIINISAELPNSEDAAQIVNSVVEAYVSLYAEQQANSAADTLSILHTEKGVREKELAAARAKLDEFRSRHPTLAVQMDSENVVTRRFSTLAETLNQTEMALLDATAQYNRAKEMYDNPDQRVFLLDVATSKLGMQTDLGLKTRLEQVELTLTSERAQWGEGHPKVKLLRESWEDLQERLRAQQASIIAGYLEKMRQDYELLVEKRNELQREYDKQFALATEAGSQALELASLIDGYQRTEKLTDLLDDRIKEVDLSEEVGAMKVSIMELAVPSSSPSYPIPSRFLAMGLMLGGLGGFGLAWLRELLDHRLRSIDEVASALQLPVLGALPYFGEKKSAAEVGQLVARAPHSPPAEAIRTLRTALHFSLGGGEIRTVVVTSPAPGDGKSTVASNLAIAMCQAGHRVLLIDADLRKPTQHKIFESNSPLGLGSVLTERQPVEEAIQRNVVSGLDLLPCGKCPSNPVELLNNEFFVEMIESLKSKYDRIVIDSPPIMPVADARVICAMSDATILVLRAEKSTRRVSIAARNELWGVRAKRLGVVVNGVPNQKHGSYYGYGYGEEYGYGSYGQEQSPAKAPRRKRRSSRSDAAQEITIEETADA